MEVPRLAPTRARRQPPPSLWVVRAAAVMGAVVPVYGLLRLLTGLFHWILPTRVLEAVPELVSDVHNAHAIASGAILFFLGLRLLRRHRGADDGALRDR